MRIRLKIYSLFFALICSLLLSCKGKPASGNTRQITVTIEPLRYFTEQIAGNKFNVTSMVPKGSSPETYDPTPQQLVQLAKSMAYFRIGYIGFEQIWMKRLQQIAPQMKIFDASKDIAVIHTTHEGKSIDPHIWNSTANARIIAQNIYKFVCQLDTANQTYYEQNLHTLLSKIEKTEKEIRKCTSQCPDEAFLIFHPALTYYAQEFGLRQISIEENGKEPSPEYLKQLIETCRKEHVKVTFIQQEFDRRNAELIARETHTRLVTVNPLNYQWDEEMIHIAKTLCHE